MLQSCIRSLFTLKLILQSRRTPHTPVNAITLSNSSPRRFLSEFLCACSSTLTLWYTVFISTYFQALSSIAFLRSISSPIALQSTMSPANLLSRRPVHPCTIMEKGNGSRKILGAALRPLEYCYLNRISFSYMYPVPSLRISLTLPSPSCISKPPDAAQYHTISLDLRIRYAVLSCPADVFSKATATRIPLPDIGYLSRT